MDAKAVVLLSGGLDSATTLFLAKAKGYDCRPLVFDYGQRHAREIESAKKIARSVGLYPKIVKIDLPWKGSSLLDRSSEMPVLNGEKRPKEDIPSTYVPARNIIFLSMALSYAEAIEAEAVFIGANAVDFSGYPDCRPDFYEAFKKMSRLGTKAGVEGREIEVLAPLISKTKADIVKLAAELGVPFGDTWSCYQGKDEPCGVCDSCRFREKGFREAGVEDPLAVHKAAITEVFSSIQGEGPFVGARQVFVRFKDCNMKCAWCDVEPFLPAKEYTIGELMEEIKSLEADHGPHHSVSLTGGEPLLYAEFLKELASHLKSAGFSIYLETNGTLPEKLTQVIDLIDIVAMDFKLPSSTAERDFWKEHEEFLKISRGKEAFVKAVVTNSTEDADIEKSVALMKAAGANIPFIIQPVDPRGAIREAVSEKRLSDFLDIISREGLNRVRVMPQVHKILGVR